MTKVVRHINHAPWSEIQKPQHNLSEERAKKGQIGKTDAPTQAGREGTIPLKKEAWKEARKRI